MHSSIKHLGLSLVLTLPTVAQESEEAAEYPEIVAFAEAITDVTWWSRGTFKVKGVRYDGEALVPVDEQGRPLRPYDTYFLDVGLLRVVYSDDTSSWYFFDDDLKYHTSTKILSERVFSLPEGQVGIPISDFPKNIEGVVFESLGEEPGELSSKIRWNGEELEVAVLNGETWKTERNVPIVAERRVFELRASKDVVLWFVFGSDGSEAWLLEVQNIFGSHRDGIPAQSAVTPAESGLPPPLNDLANHMIDLVNAGVKEPAWTLQRQFERKLADQPELLERLKKRVNNR